MWNRNKLMIASLCLNLSLLGSCVYWLKTHQRSSKLADGAAKETLGLVRASAETLVAGQYAGFHWGQLESTNYRVYIANLRALGCPEQTLRDIIGSEINQLYAPKIAAAQRSAMPQNYWERPRPWSPDRFAKQRELFKERNALIKELLGIDVDEEAQKNNQELGRNFSFLDGTKGQKVRALENKYFDLERRIYANSNGLITPDDQAALAALRQQKAAEMDALLTPQEQFEYALRTSPTSRQLQQELDAFQPNEAEFRAIYQAQTALDSARGRNGDGRTAQETSGQAEREFENQLRAALGEQRYADYHRSKDPGYQFLLKMADRYGLPREVAGQVFDLKQGVDAQTRQVMADSHYGEDQKRAWFQAVRNQTEQTLAGMLGEKGFSLRVPDPVR